MANDDAATPDTTATDAPKKGNYGAEQISVLEGLEAVRKRPGMAGATRVYSTSRAAATPSASS